MAVNTVTLCVSDEAEQVGNHRSDIGQYPSQEHQGEQPSKEIIHAGQGTRWTPFYR